VQGDENANNNDLIQAKVIIKLKPFSNIFIDLNVTIWDIENIIKYINLTT